MADQATATRPNIDAMVEFVMNGPGSATDGVLTVPRREWRPVMRRESPPPFVKSERRKRVEARWAAAQALGAAKDE